MSFVRIGNQANTTNSSPNSHRSFRTLARNWEAFGDVDPLFGVLSDPTKHGGKWSRDEFFESGRAHVDKLMRILGDFDVTFQRGACLDFGCGVGRLTFPLSRSFDRTVGVDVARSMIAVARRQAHRGQRCEFIVNRAPHLRRFPDATFDFVHSCLVLQHIPPEIALGYVGEFLRICKPGGVVAFQLPAETYSESVISDRYALPAAACDARIVLSDPPASLVSSEWISVRLVVANESPVTWRHDIPAGRHITIANHWLRPDGTVAIPDDGRAYLLRTLEPGGSCDVELSVQAPVEAGEYLLEVDLVQERVCWFAEKGSRTARVPINVLPAPLHPQVAVPASSPVPQQDPRPSVFQRINRLFRRGTPTFEMHVVPRADVERAILEHGDELLHAIDDGAAGYRWLSYTYVCRRS